MMELRIRSENQGCKPSRRPAERDTRGTICDVLVTSFPGLQCLRPVTHFLRSQTTTKTPATGVSINQRPNTNTKETELTHSMQKLPSSSLLNTSETKKEVVNLSDQVDDKTTEGCSSKDLVSPRMLVYSQEAKSCMPSSPQIMFETTNVNYIKLLYPEYFPTPFMMEQRTKTEIKEYAKSWHQTSLSESTADENEKSLIENWLDFF